jgi:hypothetical protein
MSRPPEFKTLAARLSTSLSATLGAPRPLRYDRDAGPASALPAHVRAASAIRRQGTRLVILQDDVSALVLLDPVTGSTRPVLLPAGEGGARVFDDGLGNKKFKLDLEASVVLPDGRLLALGSGSSRRREQIATLADEPGALALLSSGAEKLTGAAIPSATVWSSTVLSPFGMRSAKGLEIGTVMPVLVTVAETVAAPKLSFATAVSR